MNPLPPLPRPDFSDAQGVMKAPWVSWFAQLYNFLTAGSTGGGGLVPNTRKINTTAPLQGGGDLTADRTLNLQASGVTNAFLAVMAPNTLKGNNTGVSANPIDLTASQVKTLLAISLTTDVTGTLQAAQEPAHSGDVTNSAGSLTLTIANNAVTNAKAAQMGANTIKGNNTAGTANASDLTASQVKTLLSISLSSDVTGTLQAAQEPAHTGDVTNSAGSLALTIANNVVTNAKLAQMGAHTVKGNNTGSTANASDLSTVGAGANVAMADSGTFTPTMTGATTAGTTTYATQVGMYTRIGNRVFFNLQVQWTAATGTGQILIGGLPFAHDSTSGAHSAMAIYYNGAEAVDSYMGLIFPGGQTVNLYSHTNGVGAAFVNVTGAGDIFISGNYPI